MSPLSPTIFDAFALALPYGLGFGDYPPIEACISDDGHSWAAVLRRDDGDCGVVAMRRREDRAWTQTLDQRQLPSVEVARALAVAALKDAQPFEPLPPAIARRPALWDVEDRQASGIFKLLAQPTHSVAAWMLNQLYMSMPDPDRNWASDCQTDNFHTRLWEAQLFAALREQGLLVTQPHRSPDFYISNRAGNEAWIEAVTANPDEARVYEHFNTEPCSPPATIQERMMGPAAVRFAKTIGSKLQKRYHELPHVKGKSLAIALADFHAPSSMTWSREALSVYLYGQMPHVELVNGLHVVSQRPITHLMGSSGFKAGLFCDDAHAELSAVIFTNASTIAKLSRVPISSGFLSPKYRYARIGTIFDRSLGALAPASFSLDITSAEYKNFWPPYKREPWTAELEVYHNPFAHRPIPRRLMPEAQHWYAIGGEVVCQAFFKTSILKSQSLILPAGKPIPSANDWLRVNDIDEMFRGVSKS